MKDARKGYMVLARIRVDIDTAFMCLNSVNNSRNRYYISQASYSVQQACEKLIKIQIYQNSNYTVDEVKSHNISSLIRRGKKYNIFVPESITSMAIEITSWEASSRYDISFIPDAELVSYFAKECDRWYNYLLNKGYKYM